MAFSTIKYKNTDLNKSICNKTDNEDPSDSLRHERNT
jgi:hypothetical protein